MTFSELAQAIDDQNDEVLAHEEALHAADTAVATLKAQQAEVLAKAEATVNTAEKHHGEALKALHDLYAEMRAKVGAGPTSGATTDPTQIELKRIALEGQRLRKR